MEISVKINGKTSQGKKTTQKAIIYRKNQEVKFLYDYYINNTWKDHIYEKCLTSVTKNYELYYSLKMVN